ncbi:MarR family transcriptional regulator [Rhodopseudomonas boonkerdii]|uniref:MarR family transcriptional regulator n=1 Tax=Rhodopseudomonas boonkerdii TaxID=475937 RepID=UPI001E48A93F|nr:MarR family transcriptional regulator [Rhodopseudomonas boonkerdii]UGV27229.1 MarR family transcriptional regulator [Rhodopseudomonas boonkerdii]
MNHGFEPACNAGRLHPAVAAYAEWPVWRRAGDLLRLASFRPALHAYCKAMMQPPKMAWPADKFFGQKLRYLVSYALIGQDARWRRSGGELPTLSSLQRAAHASARQVSNLVASLKLGGYVVSVRSSDDRRVVRLQPTMTLSLEIARSPLTFLEASELIDPPPRPLAKQLRAEGDMLGDWLGCSYDLFLQQDLYFTPFVNIVRLTEQDCGYPVLSAVLSAHYGGGIDKAEPVLLSYGALAERFRLSRQHIGNIFNEAERRGCFAVDPGGRTVTVLPDFLWEFETWAAGQIALYRLIAEQVTRDRCDQVIDVVYHSAPQADLGAGPRGCGSKT